MVWQHALSCKGDLSGFFFKVNLHAHKCLDIECLYRDGQCYLFQYSVVLMLYEERVKVGMANTCGQRTIATSLWLVIVVETRNLIITFRSN